jgi:uracil-DNA glycosylase
VHRAFGGDMRLEAGIRRTVESERITPVGRNPELDIDLGSHQATDGSLVPWAEHGVLLLDRILTVTRDEAGSHAGFGWQPFTLALISAVARQPGPVVFLLWGAQAATLRLVIGPTRHVVLTSSHPSPISARLDFIGSAPFRTANEALQERGAAPIDWRL